MTTFKVEVKAKPNVRNIVARDYGWSRCHTFDTYTADTPEEVAEAFYMDFGGYPRNKDWYVRVTPEHEVKCFEYQAPQNVHAKEVTCTG